jgi:hypothetical protein
MERAEGTPAQTGTKEPLIKQVFVGVGKAIESQSPRAWNERIIKAINEKIIPKLTPEQRTWLAHHPKLVRTVEIAATGVGIAISTTEMFLATLALQSFVRKIQEIQKKRAYQRLPPKEKVNIALHRSYSTMPETLVQEKIDQWAKKLAPPEYKTVVVKEPWRPQKKAGKIMKAILQKVGARVSIPVEKTIYTPRPIPESARWFIDVANVYNEKYANSAEAALLAGTLRVMLERLSPWGKQKPEARERMLGVTRDLASGMSHKEHDALTRLKPFFRSAFTEAANRYHQWYGNSSARAMIQRAKADEMLGRWLSLGMDRNGLADMGEFVMEDFAVGDRLRQGIRAPLTRDFEPVQAPVTALEPQAPDVSGFDWYREGSFFHPNEPLSPKLRAESKKWSKK